MKTKNGGDDEDNDGENDTRERIVFFLQCTSDTWYIFLLDFVLLIQSESTSSINEIELSLTFDGMAAESFHVQAMNEKNMIDPPKSPMKSTKRKKPNGLNGYSNGGLEIDAHDLSHKSSPKIERLTSMSSQPASDLNLSVNKFEGSMITSMTHGDSISLDNDVIEIHQFTVADLDDYLEIYFDTLNQRLRHYLGGDQAIEQFRATMKNRITSNPNAIEYQNVLLGKIGGDVVAAVALVFPNHPTTIPNDALLRASTSCWTSMRRWMVRKANYAPTDADECYIEMIGVKSAYRNHGIGSAMLECVEHFAQQSGARILTIHASGEGLRHYFQRFDFYADPSDHSSFWKWMVEREDIKKMSKTISLNEPDSMDMAGSFTNRSLAESVEG